MEIELLLNQLDKLITSHKEMQTRSLFKDLSDLPMHERQALVTKSVAAVHRITGSNSIYSLQVNRIIKEAPILRYHTSSIMGVVTALRDDIDSGYIESLTEIIHAEMFADFLDMARHLCTKGFKDSAAVIAGSTLESHIKKLALKFSITIEVAGRPEKTESLNQKLAKEKAYNLLDQKNVTAWLDLRNKAAHGDYQEYNIDQVRLLISSIQDFITRNPA